LCTTYTGTFTGATTGSLVGYSFEISGFNNGYDNGAFTVTANTGTNVDHGRQPRRHRADWVWRYGRVLRGQR